MPHQLLLYANRRSRLIQQATVRVSEGVPSQTADPYLLTLRLQDLPLDDACVVAAARNRRREDQAIGALALPIAKDMSEGRIEGNIILRRLRFDLSDAPIDD